MHPKNSSSLRGLRICLGYHPFLLFGLARPLFILLSGRSAFPVSSSCRPRLDAAGQLRSPS